MKIIAVFIESSKMNAMQLPIALFLLGLASFSWQCDVPKVNTPLGGIIGCTKLSRSNRKYAAYEGVPYAQPPVGGLRFEPPQPVKKWENYISATEKSSACSQYLMQSLAVNGDRVAGDEDCLYLNVYVPIENVTNSLLPVIFWIHGGAYQFSSGNQANETLLMDRDVIVVTMNYRLGPMGFLSTGNNVVPGNMGLKDQSLALRWVNENIESFGGDSKQITIIGVDAGSSSCHYHYLSPLSAGLFQRGVSISGVALDPWPQTKRAPEKAKKLGELLGCPTSDVQEMVNCLKDRPAREISHAVGEFQPFLYNPFTPFGPVIEPNESNLPKPFITRSPIEIISRGEAQDIPWISGVVSGEGLFPAAEFVANDTLLKQLNDEWDKIAPYLLDFNDTIAIDKQAEVAKKIRKQYLGSQEINSDTVPALIRMIGDRLFSADFEKAIRLQAKINKSPCWAYYYSYRAENSFSMLLGASNKNFGVSHGDDILLILNTIISNTNRPDDIQMQELLLDFYTSFAIKGEPQINGVKWEALKPDADKLHYLHIRDPKTLRMECNANFAKKKFWDSIHFKENRICTKKSKTY